MKKYLKYIVIAAIFFFILANPVLAADANLKVCEDSGVLKTFQMAGYVLYVVKIVVPLLLILFGIVDMVKVIISGDDGSLNKQVAVIIKRGIVAIIVFLIPSVVDALFSVVTNYSDVMEEYKDCYNCIMTPSDSSVCKAK